MRYRLIVLSIFLFALFAILTGCSRMQEESFGSGWTGLVADVGPQETETATPSVVISVVPAQASLKNGASVPISVKVSGISNKEGSQPTVAMSSSSGGSFDPSSGATSDYSFLTNFTAPAVGQGITNITAMVDGQTGSCSINIIGPTPDVYNVRVVPSSLTLGQRESTPITVKVTDQNGLGVDSADVTLTNSLQATFNNNTGTTSNGVFTAILTSGDTAGNCLITAASKGVTGTATIVITINPSITIIPAQTSMTNGNTQTIVVKIVDERGNPLPDIRVNGTSSAGGTFNESSLDTGTNGMANFSYTAPGTPGITDTLTFQALGITRAVAINIL